MLTDIYEVLYLPAPIFLYVSESNAQNLNEIRVIQTLRFAKDPEKCESIGILRNK
jgi:hypothetical protein